MKNVLLAGLLVVGLTFSITGCGGGNKYMSAYVPSKVVDEFYNMYPSASDVKWKNKNGLYEADFELGHQDLKADFTPDGNFVRIDS